MHFEIITLFPEMFDLFFSSSIVGRAKAKGCYTENRIGLRKYALNRYGQVDDEPYGGEPGMILRCEPAAAAIREAAANCGDAKPRVVFFTPQGRLLTQAVAQEYASAKTPAVLFCGHYKGLDERIIEGFVDDEISVGDFVLTGGELPAMVFMDAVIRLLDDAIGNIESARRDSFQEGRLEGPIYTRPEEFEGRKVPDILLSGHHKNIEEWKKIEGLRRTLKRRPDLIDKQTWSDEDRKRIEKLKGERI